MACCRTVLLHALEELHNNLRTWPAQDLALTTLLRVDDVVEAIAEDANLDHFEPGLGMPR